MMMMMFVMQSSQWGHSDQGRAGAPVQFSLNILRKSLNQVSRGFWRVACFTKTRKSTEYRMQRKGRYDRKSMILQNRRHCVLFAKQNIPQGDGRADNMNLKGLCLCETHRHIDLSTCFPCRSISSPRPLVTFKCWLYKHNTEVWWTALGTEDKRVRRHILVTVPYYPNTVANIRYTKCFYLEQ